MVIGRLTGIAATLSLLGATGAGAETIYVTDPSYVEPAPGYVYVAPAPVAAPRYIVTESGQVVMAAPQRYVVVAPQSTYVAPQPTYVLPQATYVTPQPTYVAPRYGYGSEPAYSYSPNASGVVSATYVEPRCTIDSFGIERCY